MASVPRAVKRAKVTPDLIVVVKKQKHVLRLREDARPPPPHPRARPHGHRLARLEAGVLESGHAPRPRLASPCCRCPTCSPTRCTPSGGTRACSTCRRTPSPTHGGPPSRTPSGGISPRGSTPSVCVTSTRTSVGSARARGRAARGLLLPVPLQQPRSLRAPDDRGAVEAVGLGRREGRGPVTEDPVPPEPRPRGDARDQARDDPLSRLRDRPRRHRVGRPSGDRHQPGREHADVAQRPAVLRAPGDPRHLGTDPDRPDRRRSCRRCRHDLRHAHTSGTVRAPTSTRSSGCSPPPASPIVSPAGPQHPGAGRDLRSGARGGGLRWGRDVQPRVLARGRDRDRAQPVGLRGPQQHLFAAPTGLGSQLLERPAVDHPPGCSSYESTRAGGPSTWPPRAAAAALLASLPD